MPTARSTVINDGLPILVRQAALSDAEQLYARHMAAIAERSDNLITQPEDSKLTLEQERAWIEEAARSENSTMLVAEREGEILGWAVLRGGKRKRSQHRANLGLVIAPAWRRRGVGAALMEVALDWAQENPVVEKLTLGVVATNEPALHLYRKLGFVEEGRLPRQYKTEDGRYLDNVLMYRFVGRGDK